MSIDSFTPYTRDPVTYWEKENLKIPLTVVDRNMTDAGKVSLIGITSLYIRTLLAFSDYPRDAQCVVFSYLPEGTDKETHALFKEKLAKQHRRVFIATYCSDVIIVASIKASLCFAGTRVLLEDPNRRGAYHITDVNGCCDLPLGIPAFGGDQYARLCASLPDEPFRGPLQLLERLETDRPRKYWSDPFQYRKIWFGYDDAALILKLFIPEEKAKLEAEREKKEKEEKESCCIIS